MPVKPANLKNTYPNRLRLPKLGLESAVALAGTAFSALLLVLTAMNAGPLWRDETNTFNVAQMHSWNSLTYDSFPPLWLLIVRGWSLLGIANGDAGIRILGLLVGLLFLLSLWLCSWWIGNHKPILSIALLGSLPAFIFTVGSNRAYGLAGCLLVFSFGMIWRMVELPSRARIFWAGFTCFVFVHTAYYAVVFLCAMLAGGIMVVICRRQWKAFLALVAIGAVSGASQVIYLPIIHRGSAYLPLFREPFFDSSALWNGFRNSLAARSSAQPGIQNSLHVWVWVGILLGGFVVAIMMQRARGRQAQNLKADLVTPAAIRSDVALFCVVSLLLGGIGYLAFLFKLQYVILPWYCVEFFCLCAISLDGILGANWPALRPWGLLRIGFMVAMMTWGASSAWEEAHTRRSNVDLIANVLGQKASAGDLIVVQTAWEGITFDRYYHGQTHWITIPPIDSHKVHRTDLILEKINQPDSMDPVLREITDTLRHGNNVWLVGHVTVVYPEPLAPPPRPPEQLWMGFYFDYWSAQVTTHLLNHALQLQVLKIPVDRPVSLLENLPVVRFSGYKSDAN